MHAYPNLKRKKEKKKNGRKERKKIVNKRAGDIKIDTAIFQISFNGLYSPI